MQSLKPIDDNNVLVTYRFKHGKDDLYLYVVFEKDTMYYEVGENISEAGDYEMWICYGEYYFATKAVSYDEIKDLRIGETMPEKLLDKLAIYDDIDLLAGETSDGVFIHMAICPVKEGIAIITLESETETSVKNMSLKNIEFYAYGTEGYDAAPTVIANKDLIELP